MICGEGEMVVAEAKCLKREKFEEKNGISIKERAVSVLFSVLFEDLTMAALKNLRTNQTSNNTQRTTNNSVQNKNVYQYYVTGIVQYFRLHMCTLHRLCCPPYLGVMLILPLAPY